MFKMFRNWREETDIEIITARYQAFIDVIQYMMVLFVIFLVMAIFAPQVLLGAFMCFVFLMHSWYRWSIRTDKAKRDTK